MVVRRIDCSDDCKEYPALGRTTCNSLTRVVFGERRQIEEAGDVVDVEQMHLVRATRETHGDHRQAREKWIAFPRFQRNGSQTGRTHRTRCRADDRAPHPIASITPTTLDGVHSELPEEPPEVIAEIAMPTNTQSLQCAHSLNTGDIHFRPVTRNGDEGLAEWYRRTMRLVQSRPSDRPRLFACVSNIAWNVRRSTGEKLSAIDRQLKLEAGTSREQQPGCFATLRATRSCRCAPAA